MEKYLELQAKKGFESAAIYIGNIFYILGSSRFARDYIIIDYKDLADKLDIAKDDDNIIFIHSHLNCSSNPSSIDLEIMELWPDMVWWIYSIYNGEIHEIWKSF